MGYYTKYNLTFSIWESNGKDNEEIEKIHQYIENCIPHLYENGHTEYEYDGKWYDYVKDMTELSKQFPNAVFQLDGVGEEFPDIWTGVWKNGKKRIEGAEIVYPKIEIEDLE